MRFDVILADPPWHFKVWNEQTGSGRSASRHYPTMNLDQICALPVDMLAAENCALFLWITWPMLFHSVPVMKAWGFRYATKAFTWVKSKADGTGFHMGLGYYTRANDEVCLLAVKGRMQVQAHNVLGIIYAPVQKHSRKPEEQYEKIERLYPHKRYCELFARERRPGWAAWGNEIDSDFHLEGHE